MKRLPTMLLSLLVALAAPVVLAPTAYAKGATSVVVSGPGIADRSLGYTRRTDDVDVGALAEASGIYLIYGAAVASDDPGLTEAELGPRYVLTWYTGSMVMSVSHVYPFAANGAWTHLPDEDGGWVRGGPTLERAMADLGATRPQRHAAPGVSTSSTVVGSGSRTEVEPVETSTSTLKVAGAVGVAGLLLLIGAGARFLWRRRTPPG